MAVRVDGNLQATSAVLTKDQMRRLDAIVEMRTTAANRPSRSDVIREVIEIGLRRFSAEPFSDFAASDNEKVPA